MKSILSLFIIAVIILTGCKADSESDVENKEPIKINPLDRLEQVDKLLSELSKKPQQFEVSSNKETEVSGAKGTVIHVDPNRLETIDGSPLGENIQVELLEMTDNSSMLLNNTQTVSNGQILVTGGAYYLNMTSGGKQLKMKEGKGLEVQFPKLSEDEMGLFLGERDSLGQMNWIQANQPFNEKKLDKPVKPKKKPKKKTTDNIDAIFDYVDNYESTLTEEELKEYRQKLEEYDLAKQTYQAVELSSFGWINCDRFMNDQSPKINIELIVKNDSLSGARFYAIFSDIKSIMTGHYYNGMENPASFKNVPKGKDITIIAISVKNEKPYMFETKINTSEIDKVFIDLSATSKAAIEERMRSFN